MTKLFKKLWYGIDLSRRIFLNVIFFIIMIIFIAAIAGADDKPKVEDGIALILQPTGVIVEQKTYVDPVDQAMQEASGKEQIPETLLYDLIEAIDNAKDDKRITALVISTNYLWGSGVTKLQDLADAIQDFKTSGKKVIAFGDNFSQSQYYLAAQADEIIMSPQGGIFITGFARIGTYFKPLLDNIGINVHVFKVGKYKSAVEPFMRKSMSEAAKEANRQWMNDLWTGFQQDIAQARNLTSDDIASYINNYKENLIASNGNSAAIAVDAGLVDQLLTRIEFREKMVDLVGLDSDSKSYKAMTHRQYLKAIKSPLEYNDPDADKVAVITAKGSILDGEHKEGTIGGDTVARLIRKTRQNKHVKAIVLRVDSGGGSAFASEVIRQELVQAQADGIKVVVSMGDVAASGGYWISATADEIWARPSTITGSIGIFGMIPTFEKPLNKIGIYRDGVGTTKYSNPIDGGLPLSDDVAEIIQTSINAGYDNFLSLVAKGRDMTIEQVDNIAQGRVWSGAKALEIGLVDKLGTLNDAIESAAKLANLEDYKVLKVKRKLSENEKFLKELFNQASFDNQPQQRQSSFTKSSLKARIVGQITESLNMIDDWNDPNHAYANCFCSIENH
ncbi:MAG: signal peptide peptidase SppA [Enterobacterales bacterium]|nr:signal peptide peptidase SppA [Enterobacterales bacterium]